VPGEPWEKIRATAVYHPGPVFDFKRFLHRLLPKKKAPCTTYRLMPPKFLSSPPLRRTPQKNNGPSLFPAVKKVLDKIEEAN